MTGDEAFAIVHVPGAVRPAIAALWALDATLGRVVAATMQPIVGQLRLTWWHEALEELCIGAVRGEPVLDALAAHVVPTLPGHVLAGLVEGWEALLDPLPLSDAALALYADRRGALRFALSAQLLGGVGNDAAGRGWALADFAMNCSDPDTANRARAQALSAFAAADVDRLPRPLRVLARLALVDAQAGCRQTRTHWATWRAMR